MGFRFRKNISILPGVRLNLSKGGISSLSVGGKGLTYNIGKKGTRATGGLPGTGMSYSHYDKYAEGKAPAEQPKMRELIDRETGEIVHIPAEGTAATSSLVAKALPWLKVAGLAIAAYAVNYVRKH